MHSACGLKRNAGLRASLWQSADDHHGSQLSWRCCVGCRYAHLNRLICRQSRHKQVNTAGRQGAGLLPMSCCMPTSYRTRQAHSDCNFQDAAHIAGLHDGSHRACNTPVSICLQVFVCRSGSAADTQAISAYVEHYIEQHEMELGRGVAVKTAANLAMQLVYNNKVSHRTAFALLPPFAVSCRCRVSTQHVSEGRPASHTPVALCAAA